MLTDIEKFKHIIFEAKMRDKATYSYAYITKQEQQELLALSDAAFMLYRFWHELAGYKKEITDEAAMEEFGWTDRKVERIRQQLTKAGWFRKVHFTTSSKVKGLIFYLGQDKVEESYRNEEFNK